MPSCMHFSSKAACVDRKDCLDSLYVILVDVEDFDRPRGNTLSNVDSMELSAHRDIRRIYRSLDEPMRSLEGISYRVLEAVRGSPQIVPNS